MLGRSAESDFPRDITRVQSKAAGRAWLTRICYWRLAEESDDPFSLGGTAGPGRPLFSQTWVTLGLRTIQKAKAGIGSWPSLAFRKVAPVRSMMK